MSSSEGEQTTTVVMPTLVITGRKGIPSEDVVFTRKLLQQQPFPLRQEDGQGRRDGRSQRRRVVMLYQSVQKGFRFHAGSFSVRLSGDEDVSDLKLKTVDSSHLCTLSTCTRSFCRSQQVRKSFTLRFI